MAMDDPFSVIYSEYQQRLFHPKGGYLAAVYIDLNAGAGTNSNAIMNVKGGGTNRGIYIQSTNIGTNTFSLYVDNNFKENFTLLQIAGIILGYNMI